jgi:hypothetical protein
MSSDLYIPHSAAAQTMFADIVTPARQFDLDRSAADLPGGFTKKTLRDRVYWYYQIKSPDGKPMQIYIGADSPATRALVESQRSAGTRALGRAHLQRLCRSAIELGCAVIAPTHARILARLVDHGFFHAGGVLVGTHAFIAYQNHLGVQWTAGTKTQDIDFAHPGRNISIAMPLGITANTRAAIDSLQMGFVPNVAQTTYTKADEPDLQLDFVTTRGRSEDRPLMLPELNITLQPLKFMEYVLEDTLHGVLLTRQGPLVVNLPRPERYALHKLIVHGERSAELRAKAVKDLDQAASLLNYFLDNQPDDLMQAWEDLSQRGKGWVDRYGMGLKAMGRRHPELAARWATASSNS